MAKRNKTIEKKLWHNCPSCPSTYTLLETWEQVAEPLHHKGECQTHLTRKDLTTCQINCKQAWEKIITKFCQEKILGSELEREQEKKENGSN